MKYEKELQELHYMQQIYADMFTVTNRIQNNGDKYLRELTLRQFMTILAILHLPQEETTLNQIAKKLGTTKQNVSIMISGLEKKGIVSTVPNSRDKRSVNVIVTESGLQVMEQCGASSILYLEKIFHNFDLEELKEMWEFLKKMLHFLSEDSEGFEKNITPFSEQEPLFGKQLEIMAEFSQKRKAIEENGLIKENDYE